MRRDGWSLVKGITGTVAVESISEDGCLETVGPVHVSYRVKTLVEFWIRNA